MLRANSNLESLTKVEQYLEENPVPHFEREQLPLHNNTPAPQVDFEIRHTREHLEKLKFNWLELRTKSTFLTHLTNSEEWRECQSTRWTPGELKQLEKELEPSKNKLKRVKGKTAELQSEVAEGCELLVGLEDELKEKHGRTKKLVQVCSGDLVKVQKLQEKIPNVSLRSVEELQSLLDEQSISLEKKNSALERQKNALADLERLLALHEEENNKLIVIKEELENKRLLMSKKDTPSSLEELCQWYSLVGETISRLAGCRVEMIQPDYLLATVGNELGAQVPVHIIVDPLSGRLKGVKIGSTSSTPKRQWKEIVDIAIENNDIPFLIRSILRVI